jgi:hypothetical protein
MTTGFDERLAFGNAVQEAIAADLAARGLAVRPFGQALLAPEVRDILRQTNSLLRWLPDLVGWRPRRPRLFLIDAKGTMRRATTNHSIELRVLLAARFTMLPTFYICDDRKALAADDVWPPVPDGPIERYCCDGCLNGALADPTGRLLPSKCPEHARRSGRGSGTPYAIIPKTACASLESLFGPIGQEDAA